MSNAFTHTFATDAFKGKVSVNTGLFINGKFVDASDGETIEYVPSMLIPSADIDLSIYFQRPGPMCVFDSEHPRAKR